MKTLVRLFSLVILLSFFNPAMAQNNEVNSDRNPIYDVADLDNVSEVGIMPDYSSKDQKLKLTGTIYESDGTTPASDVLLYIEQADEDGSFELRKSGDKRYNFHRVWVKTNAHGQYTIYTFVPGYDRTQNQLQEIFPVVKAPSQQEEILASFLFDEDPLLTRRCRKQIEKHSDLSRILKPVKQEDGLLMAQKDIVLSAGTDVAK